MVIESPWKLKFDIPSRWLRQWQRKKEWLPKSSRFPGPKSISAKGTDKYDGKADVISEIDQATCCTSIRQQMLGDLKEEPSPAKRFLVKKGDRHLEPVVNERGRPSSWALVHDSRGKKRRILKLPEHNVYGSSSFALFYSMVVQHVMSPSFWKKLHLEAHGRDCALSWWKAMRLGLLAKYPMCEEQ